MRITYKGDYALKTILELARCYGKAPVSIHDLAKSADIPIKFLEQILLDLKRGGFVKSRRGQAGGYTLAQTPSQIKLGSVIRFVDGPTEPIACVEAGYSACKDTTRCALRQVWQRVSKATNAIIDEVSFEDLLRQSKDMESSLVYYI